MGMSRRWVQDLEGGKRQADPRLSVLECAAEILHISLEQLLADDAERVGSAEQLPIDVSAVLEILDRHDVLTGSFTSEDEPPSCASLKRSLDYCCGAFQASQYASIGRELPRLLLNARRAVAVCPIDSVCEAHGILSRVYQLTASFLHKFGSMTTAPAAVAAERALSAGELSGDPVAVGAASRRVAKSLLAQDRGAAAVEFAVAAAERLRADLAAAGPLGLSTLGMLYLNAAVASASKEHSTKNADAAAALVDEADESARRQGGDLNMDWTAFGPTNVQLHRVDVLVRFEDGWAAAEAAGELNRGAFEALTRERRAQHHLAMARAGVLTRRREDAAQAVLLAAQVALQEVAGRPSSTVLVRDIVGLTPQPSRELRMLAERCGLRA